jgi:hypothetical protein
VKKITCPGDNNPVFPVLLDPDFRGLVMELRDDGMNQFGKITIPELHGSCTCSGVEEDVLILREQLIDIDVHIVEVSEWGHRPHFAVGKEICKLDFRRESHVMGVQHLFE